MTGERRSPSCCTRDGAGSFGEGSFGAAWEARVAETLRGAVDLALRPSRAVLAQLALLDWSQGTVWMIKPAAVGKTTDLHRIPMGDET